MRYSGHRRGPRGHRGRGGVGKAGRAHGSVHPYAGRRGKPALQPLYRRHCQGPPCARDRRPRRRNGHSGRRHVPAKPHVEPWQGPGGTFPARADRPQAVPRLYEASAGAHGKSGAEAGAGDGHMHKARPCDGRGNAAACLLRRKGCGAVHGHLSGRAHFCGRCKL